jgi:hypothetical protein
MTETDQTETRSWLELELEDDMDEELEQAIDDARVSPELRSLLEKHKKSSLDRHTYFTELLRLQGEFVKLQDWVRAKGLKMVVLFEGRDSAGKGRAHLLSMVPYEEVPHQPITLPDRVFAPHCERRTLPAELYVPQRYRSAAGA